MVRERVGRDIIRLHKRGVEEIAQRNCVTWLKTDVIFRYSNKRLLRNSDHLVQVT